MGSRPLKDPIVSILESNTRLGHGVQSAHRGGIQPAAVHHGVKAGVKGCRESLGTVQLRNTLTFRQIQPAVDPQALNHSYGEKAGRRRLSQNLKSMLFS